MTLSVMCDKGHPYNSYDIYQDWPDDWPTHCPVCLKNYLEQKGESIPDWILRDARESLRQVEIRTKRQDAEKQAKSKAVKVTLDFEVFWDKDDFEDKEWPTNEKLIEESIERIVGGYLTSEAQTGLEVGYVQVIEGKIWLAS